MLLHLSASLGVPPRATAVPFRSVCLCWSHGLLPFTFPTETPSSSQLETANVSLMNQRANIKSQRGAGLLGQSLPQLEIRGLQTDTHFFFFFVGG